MKSRSVLICVLATLLLGAPALASAATYSNKLTDPAAHAGEVPNTPDTDQRVGTRGWRSGIFMVGDSLTHLGLREGMHPLSLGVGWEISAVPGRNVSTLPYYLNDRLAAQQLLPAIKHSKRWMRRHRHYKPVPRYRYPLRTAVIALGTNASPGWNYANLRAAVDSLPTTTAVVFVTPYRDPAVWPESGPFRARPSVMTAYTNWELKIAQLRPHTCIADWRGFAQRWPSALRDGAHPTYNGAQAWARIVASTVARCV